MRPAYRAGSSARCCRSSTGQEATQAGRRRNRGMLVAAMQSAAVPLQYSQKCRLADAQYSFHPHHLDELGLPWPAPPTRSRHICKHPTHACKFSCIPGGVLQGDCSEHGVFLGCTVLSSSAVSFLTLEALGKAVMQDSTPSETSSKTTIETPCPSPHPIPVIRDSVVKPKSCPFITAKKTSQSCSSAVQCIDVHYICTVMQQHAVHCLTAVQHSNAAVPAGSNAGCL
jgi:hypothetical protein